MSVSGARVGVEVSRSHPLTGAGLVACVLLCGPVFAVAETRSLPLTKVQQPSAISAEMAAKAAPYLGFRPSTVIGWHPSAPGLLVRRREGEGDQLHWVAAPGAKPVVTTDVTPDSRQREVAVPQSQLGSAGESGGTRAAMLARYPGARISADGRFAFALTKRGPEPQRLVRVDLSSGDEQSLTSQLKFEVAEFAISTSADRIAFTTIEAEGMALRFLSLSSLKELPRPALVPGEITHLQWAVDVANHSTIRKPTSSSPRPPLLAFSLSSARAPRDVYTYDVQANQVMRWTNGASPALGPFAFAEPTLIRWKTADGLEKTGVLFTPDAAKFSGKRPVVVVVGAVAAAVKRGGFLGAYHYLVNELGVAVLCTSMQSGRGGLDALRDWSSQQPLLDATKMLLIGGEEGSTTDSLTASERLVMNTPNTDAAFLRFFLSVEASLSNTK